MENIRKDCEEKIVDLNGIKRLGFIDFIVKL